MAVPLRNAVIDRVREAGSLTFTELQKALAKGGADSHPGRLSKVLLDLEILGLARVSWLTKDERRIEACVEEKEDDPVAEQDRQARERDYEASFPGFEK